MEVKESYRVLELEIGASRAEVDAAYCRLLERWHPGRAAANGPEAVRDAQRKIEAINDAYNTLSVIAPVSAKPASPPPAAPPASASPAAPPPSVPPSSVTTPPSGNKPRLAPLSVGQPDLKSPPPRPPPAETWAARSGSASGVTTPPTPVPPAAPPPAKSPPPAPSPASPPAATPPAAVAPATGAPPEPEVSVPDFPEAKSSAFVERLKGWMEIYDKLCPVGTARRKYAHVVIAGTVIVLLLLGKCAFSSHSKHAREPDPKTTGRLVVKSNLPNVAVEAKLVPAPDDGTNARFSGSIDQPLAGLPPGKYAVTARSEGWPEVHGDVSVDAGHASELALNFTGGSLRLDTDPTGATVRQADVVLGKTPLVIPQLPPGECQLFLEYPSWPVMSFKATITENVESTATVRLPHGKLTVESSPPGATVLSGKRPLGQTPLTLERFPAGTKKLTLQSKDFPAVEVTVTVEDGGEAKVHPSLGTGFPTLDPVALLHDVWIPDNATDSAPPFEGLSGPSAPQNGIIKNLDRKRLYEYWLRKRYCFTGTVKAFARSDGTLEFVEQPSKYSRYRVLVKFSPEARNDQGLIAQLTKGATFSFYGRLSAVEEPHWPSKVITFEFSSVEPLP
jgi:hypothetical protein